LKINLFHIQPIDMSVNVKLSKAIVQQAKSCGADQQRSAAEQIEYWAQIGKVGLDNSDLSYSVISGILSADKESVIGEYVIGRL